MSAQEKQCKTVQEFVEMLSPSNPWWGLGSGHSDSNWGWIFRGQEEDWSLLPSALRPGALEDFGLEDPKEKTLQDPRGRDDWLIKRMRREVEIVGAFADMMDSLGVSQSLGQADKQAFTRFKSQLQDSYGVPPHLPELPPEELWPIFALAQHHGLPTRLLDWTYDPRIAAFFAARRAAASLNGWENLWKQVCGLRNAVKPRSNSAVKHILGKAEQLGVNINLILRHASCLSSRGIIDSVQRGYREAKRKRLVLIALADTGSRKVRIVRPVYGANVYLRAQRGAFSYCDYATKAFRITRTWLPLDKVAERLQQRSSAVTDAVVYAKLNLPWTQAGALLDYLASTGITVSSLRA